jgi:tetratricopeptide (TPR) repeat protein
LAVARALEALHHDRDGVANDLALHWVHAAPAGYVQEAVNACRLAARVSRARLGLDEAVSHLERALDLVSADPTQPERGRASLLVELARANGDAGRFAALLEWAIEAGRVATAAGLDDLVVASALAVPGGMSLAAVASDRRIDALLKAALALTDPASDENLMLRAKRMTTKFFVLDVDSLAAVADELLDAAQTSGHPHVVRAVAEDVAWYSRRDQHKRCVDLLRDAVDPTDPLTELPYLTQALDELYGSGDGRGFRTLFSVFTERATGSISYAVAAAFGTATLTLFDGDLTKALHQARHARHLGMVERRVSAVTSYAAFALHVAWLQGRLDRMVRLADWAWHDRPHPSNEALRAWAHAANGNEEPLRAFVANFSNIDRLMLVSARFTGGSLAALTHAAVHTGQQPALSLAGDLWAEITERFHGGFFPPDLAVNHFRAMLAHARGDLDQAEDYFRQAIIDHGSLGSAPHRSISQHELAALLTTRGRSRDGDEIHLLQTATSNGRLPGPC